MLTDRIVGCLRRLRAGVDAAVFTELTADRALVEARRADEFRSRGRPPRPLEGVTVAWKDVFDVAGCTTRAGTRFLGRGPATRDHRLVARLAARGAVCVGKTSLSELAVSALGDNDAVPAPANPHDGRRVCGGSSSGAAAAVASRLIDIGIGTDCGGSVRLPAVWCGVVGFKPSRQPIQSRGAVGFSQSLDTVGVLAPTVQRAADAVDALRSQRATTTSLPCPVRMLRIPLPPESRLDTAVAEVYEAALASLARAGFPIEETDADPLGRAWEFRGQYGSTAAVEGVARWRQIVVEAGDHASPRLRRWFATQGLPGDRGDRQRARREIAGGFSKAVPSGAVVITPTTPIEPPRLSSLQDDQVYDTYYARANALLWPFNELDAPAISVPCGSTGAGLPVGLQIVAPHGRDSDVLAAAAAVEAALASPSTERTRR